MRIYQGEVDFGQELYHKSKKASRKGKVIGGIVGGKIAAKKSINKNRDRANRHIQAALDDIENYYNASPSKKRHLRKVVGDGRPEVEKD